jgi:hypothetical protein
VAVYQLRSAADPPLMLYFLAKVQVITKGGVDFNFVPNLIFIQ